MYASMNQVSIDSDNGLSPIWGKAVILTSAASVRIGPLGTNFSGILIKIQNFSFMKMHMKILSAKRGSFCPMGDEVKTQTGVMFTAPQGTDPKSHV